MLRVQPAAAAARFCRLVWHVGGSDVRAHVVQGKSDALKAKLNGRYGKLVLQACAFPACEMSQRTVHSSSPLLQCP